LTSRDYGESGRLTIGDLLRNGGHRAPTAQKNRKRHWPRGMEATLVPAAMVTHAVPAVKGCTWKGVGQKVACEDSTDLRKIKSRPRGKPAPRGGTRDKQRGRSILTTPTERLAALRTAFQAMLKDPDFLAACEKRNLMVDGAAGEEIDEIVRETLRLPQDVAEKIGQMMQ
jgi:hypothetical protein